MTWDKALLLWCALWGVAAVVGYGMSLAGVTKAQRTVHHTGRIDRVREPRHGGSRKGGISVVVTYRDPYSGQDVTVTNDGDRGEMITTAWVGRQVGVHHLRGRAHAYRFTNKPTEPGRGLGWPGFALFLVYAGLVVRAAILWKWPWALIGFGGLWALVGLLYLPGSIRDRNARISRLAAMESVPGRIVAVLQDVSVDQDDGGTLTTTTPVVAFTTRDGTDVIAHCTLHVPNPTESRDRAVTVHYDPADPADFTLDRVAEQRSKVRDLAFTVVTIIALGATAATGVVLL